VNNVNKTWHIETKRNLTYGKAQACQRRRRFIHEKLASAMFVGCRILICQLASSGCLSWEKREKSSRKLCEKSARQFRARFQFVSVCRNWKETT